MTNSEIFIKAFTAFFVVMEPFQFIVIFAALAGNKTVEQKRKIAKKAITIAFFLLLFFTFFGSSLLSGLGISLAALRISGGFLLMIVACKMIFNTDQHKFDYGHGEKEEAAQTDNISVFPLAIPLIAGAGAISVTTLFSSEAHGNIVKYALVIISLTLVLSSIYACLVMSATLQKFLGKTFLNIITRVMGLLLAAMSVQFILDGLKNAGLF